MPCDKSTHLIKPLFGASNSTYLDVIITPTHQIVYTQHIGFLFMNQHYCSRNYKNPILSEKYKIIMGREKGLMFAKSTKFTLTSKTEKKKKKKRRGANSSMSYIASMYHHHHQISYVEGDYANLSSLASAGRKGEEMEMQVMLLFFFLLYRRAKFAWLL